MTHPDSAEGSVERDDIDAEIPPALREAVTLIKQIDELQRKSREKDVILDDTVIIEANALYERLRQIRGKIESGVLPPDDVITVLDAMVQAVLGKDAETMKGIASWERTVPQIIDVTKTSPLRDTREGIATLQSAVAVSVNDLLWNRMKLGQGLPVPAIIVSARTAFQSLGGLLAE